MKYALPILCLTLFLSGCGNNDAKLQEQLTGTWVADLGNNIRSMNVINSKGNFAARFIGYTNSTEIRIEGTFKVTGGALIETVTKSSVKTEKVPFMVRGQIIRLNSQEMVTKWETKPVSVVVVAKRMKK